MFIFKGVRTSKAEPLLPDLSQPKVFAGENVLPVCHSSSDFLVLPSLDSSEGFGLVLLEAMVTGKPVIGSNVGGVAGVIRDEENGFLVEPGNSEGLAAKILDLSSREDVRGRLGLAGRSFAEAHDWGIIAAKIERLYGQCICQ